MAILEFLAAVCGAVFSGAALYVSFVEHPARLQLDTEHAVTEFVPSYKRGAVMQASISGVGLLAGAGAWLLGSHWLWLAGALALGAPIPFTLLVIMPTNHKLMDPTLDRSSVEARQLLARWGRLHAVRTTLGTVALLILLTAIRKG